jgi:hypothetical protein
MPQIKDNSQAVLSLYLFMDKQERNKNYKDINDIYDDLRVHADGEYPTKLIDTVRPNESQAIKDYRKATFQPITKGTMSKVISALGKIRRSDEWRIKYDEKKWEKIKAVLPEERLENYCEESFPFFESVTTWMFNICLKNYLIDPNALIIIVPLNMNKEKNEYYKPFPSLFNSSKIIDYKRDEYAVVESDDVVYFERDKVMTQGKVYYTIDKTELIRWEEYYDAVKKKVGIKETWNFKHNCSKLPAFQTEGLFRKSKENTFIYESRISGVLPHLNEAVTMWSDFKAEVIQHVHSEKWMYATQDCTHCNGEGVLESDNNRRCPTCKGTKKVFNSPYNNIVLVPPSNVGMGESPLPSGAPAGYIEKTGVVDMAKAMNDFKKEQIYEALSAINLEFLADVPLNQSGVAKDVDKDEVNTFFNSIAEDVVKIMDRVYYFTNEYRYYGVITNAKTRKEMLPDIPVPSHFNILTTQYAVNEIKTAKDSNMNALIVHQMERAFIQKQFENNPAICNKLIDTIDLNPFPGMSSDEILSGIQNKGILEIDYIVYCYLHKFIDDAIAADETFFDKTTKEKYDVLLTMAQKVKDENSFDATPSLFIKAPNPAA